MINRKVEGEKETMANRSTLPYRNDLTRPRSFQVRILQLIHLPCILALVLAIIGGTRLASPDASKEDSAHDFLKTAGVLFLVVLIAIVGVAVSTVPVWRALPPGETKLLVAAFAAFPFLVVRMIYTLLVDFANDDTFNILGGNAFVHLGMSVVEEIIVTVIYLAVGLMVPSMSEQLQRSSTGNAVSAEKQGLRNGNGPYV